jgi:tripartite-type tricarboxylate transporter receptor subunit TctC
MTLTRRAAMSLAAAPLLAAALPARAQKSFATRAIKIVVPFAPGGSNDLGARLFAPKLGEVLGQPVVVDNKGGAGGAIGAQTVARAEPDGHTVLFHSNSLVIQPHLMKEPGYNAVRDFVPVSLMAQAPLVLVVHPSVPVKDFAEFLTYARAKGQDLFYGSAGIAATQHLAGELFNSMAGTQMRHVPFKGSGPALAAVVAGDIQATFDIIPTSRPMAEAGKVRMLAVTSKNRNAIVPQLPSIHEGGVPDFEMNFWQSFYLPKGTPTAIRQEWYAAVKKAMEAKDLQARLTETGYELIGSTPEQLAELMQRESAKWGKLIAAAGIRPDV